MTPLSPPQPGPILILDDVREGRMCLSALFVSPKGERPPPVTVAEVAVPAETLAEYDHATAWRVRFRLPADRPSAYSWSGETFEVAGNLEGDLRLAYVSCNGEEVGDLERKGFERNAMWARLGREHRRSPFALLLHGGDQVYADEATKGHPLSEKWPGKAPPDPSADALAGLMHHLRERFMERYVALYRSADFAWISARVPSLMQWDDHDICDGWGSLPHTRTASAVGQAIFAAARESFLVFQHATGDGDLPHRFADPSGGHFGWTVNSPGLRLLAPDLRSERTRKIVMGSGGWSMMEGEAARPTDGKTFLLSSVPLLGPRMSLFEALMVAIPKMQKYEDDLRDQWQSHTHREEWRRMLQLVRDMARAGGTGVVALSGEIHLATRAVMDLGEGDELHQLVASGITHRAPPRAWARVLGAVALLGEDPLPGHPIRIERLPGQRTRYVAERNYLTLERRAGAWHARWDLEASGMTAPLPL